MTRLLLAEFQLRSFVQIAALSAASLLFAAAAAAHVTVSPRDGVAGRSLVVSLRVPHGCSGSPTVAVRVKIPDGVTGVKPQPKPGWTLEITTRRLDPPLRGEGGAMLTETADEVAWRGGRLPDEQFDDFNLLLTLPARAAGQIVWFPTVQECEQGVARWIAIPGPGQKASDFPQPAPSMTLTAPR